MIPLLTATGLHKSYGPVRVLTGVSLEIAEGERRVLIGPNGAGKTTLFKVLSGELLANAGRIEFAGQDVSSMPEWRRIRLGFGRSFQVARIFSDMTVLENAVVAVEARLRNEGTRVADWLFSVRPSRAVLTESNRVLDEVGIGRLADTEAKTLSHGDKKRLELAMSLALRPRMLFLDEPTAGMSPADREVSVQLIARLVRDRGLTLLLTEHDMGVVFNLATVLTVLHHGQIIATGVPEDVRREPLVREVYLGRGHG